MQKRIFNANAAARCTATVTLKDGTQADCMKHRKVGTLCRQHAKIAEQDSQAASPSTP